MTRFKAAGLCALMALGAAAEDFTMNFSASLQANGGPNDFAPYYINSNRHGTLTSARAGSLSLAAWRPLDLSRRFSYSFGVEAWAQAANAVDYQRYSAAAEGWENIGRRPQAAWLQQLWGEVKYRGVFLYAGMRNMEPALVNERLSSGDLIESGNSRPIPQVRAGFVDFQNIPFTDGWVQIQGEIAWGKSTDNGWQKSHYNYYNYHLDLGWWYNYKRCFFRTKPSQPFSITVGMQAAGQFAGDVYWYRAGRMTDVHRQGFKISDAVGMLILKPGDGYWTGNHVGSWDFQARWRFNDGSELKGYFQWLWEDGSGIGKMNGMDGLWGLEWKAAERGAVSGAVLEVLTFMNQGGPMHYDYDDVRGTTLNVHRAEGADNYYNNHYYNGYALYGMGIGSPMFPSPVYNTDGCTTQYACNRFWGIHAALEGDVLPDLSYRAMASYRRFFGTMFVPALEVTHTVSAMVEATWRMPRVPGLALTAQVGLDMGNSVYGKNFGALIGATYSGIFNFKKGKATPCVF